MAARAKAARTTASKAGKAAAQARENQYVQRFIEDPELRDNVRAAFESARKAYKRMQNGKGPARALVEDKKLQKELRATADSLQQASEQLRGKRRRRHTGRKLFMLAILGGIAALILSEGARKAVLDRIFGAEEEFEYSSTTAPHAAVPS
jgi:chromatin segregation and condensation protein Rec8/ScpA/Scc1 (kleisin family)